MRFHMKPGAPRYKMNGWDRRYNIRFEKYKVIFDVFEDYEFCGNLSDPIYHPDFVKTIKYLKGKNKQINFRTNGHGKSKKWWTEVFTICQGENWKWTFALDGLPKDSYKYRINQDGEQVWEMMKLGKTFGLNISWQWIVFNYNQNDMNDGHLLAAQYGIDFFDYHSTRFYDDREIGGIDMRVYEPRKEYISLKREELYEEEYEIRIEDAISDNKVEIDADCLNHHMTKPIMFNSMGYFIPCCEKDQYVESMEKRGFYQDKYHIDNLHTAEDVYNVFTSDTWQNFYKGLYDDVKNAPYRCKEFCSKNDNRDPLTGEGLNSKGFV